nr:hypothetical protein [Thermoplasma sp.]
MERWMQKHTGRYSVIAAEAEDGIIVGCVSMNLFSDRMVHAGTADLSVYIRREFRGVVSEPNF